jgi:hypothetical protein
MESESVAMRKDKSEPHSTTAALLVQPPAVLASNRGEHSSSHTWDANNYRSGPHPLFLRVKIKVKVTLEQAIKAQRGSRRIAILFL